MMETMYCFRAFTCLTMIHEASEAISLACQQPTKARSSSQEQAAQPRIPPKTTLFTLEEF